MTDSTTRRRMARLLAVFVVLALVVIAARTSDDVPVTDVLSIPEFETVRADRLANGTPVFIVHTPAQNPDQTPVIDVIQAFATEVEGPVASLVGWCAAGGQFVDPHHGSLYDNRGRRLPSSLRGRTSATTGYTNHTALDDLVHRVAEPIEGRSDPDDPVVVTGIQSLQPWQVQDRPVLGSALPPATCRLPQSPVLPEPDADPPYRQVIDHSFLAGPIQPQIDGWQITDGWIVIDLEGRGHWCAVEPTTQSPPRCPEGEGVVDVGFVVDVDDVGGVAATIGGPVAVRLHDGVIQRAATMPDTTWRGSSLGGTERYRGVVMALDSARAEVHIVVGEQDAEPVCLDAYRSVPVAGESARAIPVSGDTQFDLLGSDTDPLTSDRWVATRSDAGSQPIAAELVVDRATCMALVVRDAP